VGGAGLILLNVNVEQFDPHDSENILEVDTIEPKEEIKNDNNLDGGTTEEPITNA
jgi:hypothetical protein